MNETCTDVTINSAPTSVKKEDTKDAESDNNSSPGRTSPETNCPICLGKLVNKSFTDSCLHQFCFNCLLEWSKVKPECPLCKQRFKAIIHNVRSMEDYDQYIVSSASAEATLFVSRELFDSYEAPQLGEPIRIGTTVSSYLDYFMRLEALSHHVIPSMPSTSGATIWQRRLQQRDMSTSDFRRIVYQQGLWVHRTADLTGRIRDCSPEFYRNNQAQRHRLVPWLTRELNVIMTPGSPQNQCLLDLILNLITQVRIRSSGFALAIAPYLGRHTQHFVHEFYSFATSPLDIVGYDREANYIGRSSFSEEAVLWDSDSDIQVLEEARALSPPHSIHLDSDSDDCVVLDSPSPPRVEPEVITLASDTDDEVVQINIQTYANQVASAPVSEPTASTSTCRRPHLKRNWLTVNNVQVPTTSSSENINVSISIAHSGRSISPCVSEASSSSWVPVRKKPTKVKKKKDPQKRTTSHKVKKHKKKSKYRAVISGSETDRSSSPVAKKRRPSVALLQTSSSGNSDSDRSLLAKVHSSSGPETRERIRSVVLPSSYVDSDSDQLFIATVSSSSSDESEYKPRIRSVVVKSTTKPEPRVNSPTFSSYSKSRLHDYDNSHPLQSYEDIPSTSGSRINAYRSTRSHQSRSRSSRSVSTERQQSKKCRHSKKRSKKDKF